MAMYPDVQKKAQQELDTLVGSQRVPETGDLSDLVYIQAILLETLRWKPIGPLGVSHAVTQDDEYDGYFIPKGTVIIPVSLLLNLSCLLAKIVCFVLERLVCPERYLIVARLTYLSL